MPSRRNPDQTRGDLLMAGFNEIHKNGFRAADVNVILAEAKVTKGALYHHFGSKRGLGLAVLDEVMREHLFETWLRPLRKADNPIDALLETLRGAEAEGAAHVAYGCPINNLAQEMAPVDEEFRQKIQALYDLWHQGIAEGLARGQKNGTVGTEIDPDEVAYFIVAACEGALGLAKSFQSVQHLSVGMRSVVRFLESLRPTLEIPATAEDAEVAAAH